MKVNSACHGVRKVDDLDDLVVRACNGLVALQELQRRYDAVGWEISEPRYHKFRHICLHLSALVGRLSDLCERLDHDDSAGRLARFDESQSQTLRDTVSNVVFHMAQLANLDEFMLDDVMRQRYAKNARRFAPNSEFVRLDQTKDSEEEAREK